MKNRICGKHSVQRFYIVSALVISALALPAPVEACDPPIDWDIVDRDLHVGGPVTITIACSHLNRRVRVLVDGADIGRLESGVSDAPNGRSHRLLCARSVSSTAEPTGEASEEVGPRPLLDHAGTITIELKGDGVVDKAIELNVRELPPAANEAYSLIYPRIALDSLRTMSLEERTEVVRPATALGRLVDQTSEHTTADPVRLSANEYDMVMKHPDWADLLPDLTLCYEARLALREYNMETERSNFQILENEQLGKLQRLASDIKAKEQPTNPFVQAARQQILDQIDERNRVVEAMKQRQGQ